MLHGTPDDRRALIPAQAAGHDLATAGAAEPLDQGAHVVCGQRRLVVVDGHRLRDRVRLGSVDPALAPQAGIQGGGAARPQKTTCFEDPLGHAVRLVMPDARCPMRAPRLRPITLRQCRNPRRSLRLGLRRFSAEAQASFTPGSAAPSSLADAILGDRAIEPTAIPERSAAVRHAQRATGQVAAVAQMIAGDRPFSEVAQQLLAARGSLDSLLLRLIELELRVCVQSREERDEVDGLLWTALGRTASRRGAIRARRPAPSPEPARLAGRRSP